jgi:putative transposase
VNERASIRGNSQSLRQGRISEAYACYFITKVVDRRQTVLATSEAATILLDSWNFLRSRDRMKLFAFCIMPDHFHLTLCLMPGEDISQLMSDSNKFTARELNKLLQRQGTFWQEGFRDHRCRDEGELHDLSLYIEHNPVRAGLTLTAEEWPYSSANQQHRHMLDREWWP